MVFSSILGSKFLITTFLAVVGTAIACGLVMSLVYLFTYRKENYSKGLSITMILLPAIVATIIMMVASDWGAALGVAGAFSIIRFRSTQGNPKDLAYIFSSLAIGLSCGQGYVLLALIFTGILAVVLLILHFIGYASPRTPKMQLKVTIPESLNYKGVFDEVMEKYTRNYKLVKVKSTNFGTMFDLTFVVEFVKDVDEKAFLDDLRMLNGNLNIMLQDFVYDPDILQ
ncbi:MAG: DUF4956 domain-containing protein [Clostridia bacterium]|nr:DUF4956 domain-containing protein [Clostridia bacterium]MBQ8382180.1 DUF4956 domain-containing protein [Clostridia bacterium]